MESVLSRQSGRQVSWLTSIPTLCHIAGYLSIFASIAIWYFAKGDGSALALAHAERFGIFVGLWAPTFFLLSMKYQDRAEST